jgi:hypothetical protein
MFNGIENRRVAAGAEYVQVHLTHPLSDKAQRFDIAVSEPYQGQRTNKSHPKHWHSLNSLLHDKAADDAKYVSWKDREADDALTQANWNSWRDRENGKLITVETGLSVITSNDKDLRQVGGLYLDWKTNELKFREHKHYYQEATASPDSYELSTTLKQGSLFHGVWFLLWQMLQGDSTDNIPALGKVSGQWLLEHLPSECSAKALAGKESPKDKSCGPVLAAKILGAIPSGKPSEGYKLVKAIYEAHYPDTWVEYFKEQWQLLGLYYSDNDDRLTLARAIRDGVFDSGE